MKKVLFAVAMFALIVAPAGASYYGDIDVAANYETGNGSYNYASNTDVDALVVGNINYGHAENNVLAVSNSGANEVAGNSGNVRLVTGDATTGVLAQNQVNTNYNYVYDGCGCEEDGISGAGNLMTGNGSTNYASNTDVDVTLVGNINHGSAENNVAAISNTGLNGVYENGGEYQEETTRVNFRYVHRGGFMYPGATRLSGSYYNYEVSYPMGGDVVVSTGDAATGVTATNMVNTNTNIVERGVPEVNPM